MKNVYVMICGPLVSSWSNRLKFALISIYILCMGCVISIKLLNVFISFASLCRKRARAQKRLPGQVNLNNFLIKRIKRHFFFYHSCLKNQSFFTSISFLPFYRLVKFSWKLIPCILYVYFSFSLFFHPVSSTY